MNPITLTCGVPFVSAREFEIVERKGLGHPDTLSDGLAESISIAYSLFCLEKYGAILHHNVDKIAIQGGQATIDFGCGEMIKRRNQSVVIRF